MAASRRVGSAAFELAGDDEHIVVERDGDRLLQFPRGWRVVTDAAGTPAAVVCLAAAPVAGELVTAAGTTQLAVAPNERVDLATGERTSPGFTPPVF